MECKETARQDISIKKIHLRNINILLKEIQSKNINRIYEIMNTYEFGIDDTDQYGWTALMCASCAGLIDIVRLLLEKNPNKYICDKKGNTALSLAKKNGYTNIYDLLRKDFYTAANNYEIKTKELNSLKDKIIYCESCQENVQESHLKSHLTCIKHLFTKELNAIDKSSAVNTMSSFNHGSSISGPSIPQNNVGYKLLVKEGWNENSGLGPSGSGITVPIGVTVKRDREGIGSKRKIIHDEKRSTRAKKLNITPESRRIAEKKKEMYLRKLLE